MKIGSLVKVEPSKDNSRDFLRGLTGKVTQITSKEGKPYRVMIDLPKFGKLSLLAEDVIAINN